MRRYIFIIIFFLALVTPFILRSVIGTDPQADRKNEQRRIVIITPHSEGIRREFQDGFSAWLKERGEKDVFLDYRNFGGGANDIVKYFDASIDLYKSIKTFKIDIVWGGGDYLFNVQLKKPKAFAEPGGYLDRVDLPEKVMADAYPSPDIGGVALYDKDHRWFGTALSSFGIVYNKDLIRYLGVPEPKTWADMTDPRYRGWLVLADPSRSASAKTAFMAIIEKAMADAWDADTAARAKHAELLDQQKAAETAGDKKKAGELKAAATALYQQAMEPGWRRGMGLIRQIAANARVFTDNSASVPATVGSGDAAAGMAIDFYGRTEVEFSGPDRVGYIEPLGATIVNPDPIALVRGAEHPELAKLFMEFVLSERGQRLWIIKAGAPGGPRLTSLRRLPIVRSVYQNRANFTEPSNPFEVAGAFNTRDDRKETFPIVGELLQASCLDLLDELKATRKEILASPRSAELDAKLGMFPYGQADAIAKQSAYKGSTAVPIKQLELMRQWTEAFHQEYEALRAEAKK